jgi:hypothetical protein
MNFLLILAAVAAVLWLASLVCAALAIGFSRGNPPRRLGAAIILAVVALVTGCLGMQMHITYSRSVNGHGWSLDSRWFFIAPLVLGAVALALALGRRCKSDPRPGDSAPPRIQTGSHS